MECGAAARLQRDPRGRFPTDVRAPEATSEGQLASDLEIPIEVAIADPSVNRVAADAQLARQRTLARPCAG
jgi:hypothetical protein